MFDFSKDGATLVLSCAACLNEIIEPLEYGHFEFGLPRFARNPKIDYLHSTSIFSYFVAKVDDVLEPLVEPDRPWEHTATEEVKQVEDPDEDKKRLREMVAKYRATEEKLAAHRKYKKMHKEN